MVSQKNMFWQQTQVVTFHWGPLIFFRLIFCQDEIIFLALAAAANKTDWTETFCRHKRNVVDRDGIRVAIDERWLKYFWPIVRPLKEFVSQRWYEATLAVGQSYLCLYWPPVKYILFPKRTSHPLLHSQMNTSILLPLIEIKMYQPRRGSSVSRASFKGPSLVQLCWCGFETRRRIVVRKIS